MATNGSEAIAYTAVAGDTWDAISYAHYGYTERLASLLMRANPRIADIVVFEGGEEVRVPVVEATELPATLPPWRRT